MGRTLFGKPLQKQVCLKRAKLNRGEVMSREEKLLRALLEKRNWFFIVTLHFSNFAASL